MNTLTCFINQEMTKNSKLFAILHTSEQIQFSLFGKQWRVFRQALLYCFLKFEKYTIAFENANKLNLLIVERIKQNQSVYMYILQQENNDNYFSCF